jgi:hypothetical protein
VPALILESKEEVRRFAEAIRRKELKDEHRTKMDRAKGSANETEIKAMLAGQRCQVNLEK